MATKAQLLSQAKIHNANVEIDDDAGIIYAYSPSGFYWSEGGTHVLAESFSNTSQSQS